MIRLDLKLSYHVPISGQVENRLKLTLELVKKEMEISKIQVELNTFSYLIFYFLYLSFLIPDFFFADFSNQLQKL